MEIIVKAVHGFFERYPYSNSWDKVSTLREIEALPKEMKNTIPRWYQELLLQFPIAKLSLGIPNDFGQPLLRGKSIEHLPLMEITFYTIDEIVERSSSMYPNYLLFKKKIIGIAEDTGSTGEGIFIDSSQENPRPIMIFHDMGESAKELIRNGEVLGEKFSDLFNFGRLTNDKIKLTVDNRMQSMDLITAFFDLMDNEIQTNEEKIKNELPEYARLVESLHQRDQAIRDGEFVSAFLKLEYGLEDSGYPLTKEHLDKMIEIYETCGLHIPELIYLKERVGNYGG